MNEIRRNEIRVVHDGGNSDRRDDVCVIGYLKGWSMTQSFSQATCLQAIRQRGGFSKLRRQLAINGFSFEEVAEMQDSDLFALSELVAWSDVLAGQQPGQPIHPGRSLATRPLALAMISPSDRYPGLREPCWPSRTSGEIVEDGRITDGDYIEQFDLVCQSIRGPAGQPGTKLMVCGGVVREDARVGLACSTYAASAEAAALMQLTIRGRLKKSNDTCRPRRAILGQVRIRDKNTII